MSNNLHIIYAPLNLTKDTYVQREISLCSEDEIVTSGQTLESEVRQ